VDALRRAHASESLWAHLFRGEVIFFQTENDAENLWNAGIIGSRKPESAGFFA
jgi:hypothetical protein